MKSAAIPPTESSRIAALAALHVLDSGPEEEFDALVKVASLVCGVPVSLISLVDTERQWFKANIGLPGVSETPRDVAFCAHAILDDGIFEVPDASQDSRFFDNPLVAAQPDIRFYAGAPIVLDDGSRIGTLCVIDRKPRELSENQREILRQLAVAAAQALKGRRAMRVEHQLAMELAKSQQLLNRVGAMAGVGGWAVDLAEKTIHWSEQTRFIHGVGADYVPKLEAALDFYAPEARPIIQAAVELAISSGQSWDLELPFIRLSGERIWVRAVGSVESENGAPARLIGAFQDVTTMRNERVLLETAQERMRLATESGGIGIWDLDLVSGTLKWDAQSYRLYGLEPTEQTAAYELWATQLHPDDKAAAEDAFRESMATGADYSHEFRIIWPDGSIHHMKGFGRWHYDQAGKAVRVVGTNMDVTESAHYAQSLKNARDKAEDGSRSKGQFLANMSHEIRTPMNAILGLLNLLQSTDLTARQSDYVVKTEGAAQSLLGLLNDILDFSKVEAGKMTLEHRPFRLDRLLRNLSVVLSSNVGQKDIEVLFDVDPGIPDVVTGDAMRLQQVLINLCGNAIKFTSQGQVVLGLRLLHITPESVAVEFRVQDSGIGIAPEHQAHIFTGFSQAEASTTRKFGGTGLGLAISKRFVELMGGDIHITSTLGVGSVFAFNVTFPLVQEVPAELATLERRTMEPRQVLIVDDNPIAADLMLHMVQSWGWNADVARSGAQALDMVAAQLAGAQQAGCYPLICMDWQMPEMDGWETTRRIRQLVQQHHAVQPTIIMVTAHGRETLAQRSEAEQNMLEGFLIKPLTASMLFDAVMDASTGNSGVRQMAKGRSSRRQIAGMRILVVEDNLINQQVADELLSAEGAIVSLAANGQLGVEAVAAAAPQFDIVLMDIQMPVLDGYGATHAIRDTLGLKDLPIIAMTANAMSTDRDACIAAGMNDHVGKPFDMGKLISLLIRTTGFQPHQDTTPTLEMDGTAPLPTLDVPGLDLTTALGRMSGMTSLYARTARDFCKILTTIIADLKATLRANDKPAALMRLHTLKGNAGTLGASLLAQESGRLETLCKTAHDSAACLQELDVFSTLVQVTRAQLEQAIALLQPAAVDAPMEQANISVSGQILAGLQELRDLLGASDLNALLRFAEMRADFTDLPESFCDSVDEALQNLDLEQAHALCTAMLQRLNSDQISL